jgi:NitT/TauT family transport system substrate-binding protein
MAVKIERGGWVLIFLIGVALVGYSLNRYGIIDFAKLVGGKSASANGETVDATKPLLIPASSSSSDTEVRVRVNVWVGCVGGLVANGGLDTQSDSIYGKKGLKVSFKIIDDWTEGASALATDNVDVMLTTADVYAKDYAQFKEKGFGSHAFLMVDWSRGADGVIGKQGINSIEDLAGKKVAFAPYTPSHFLLWNGLKTSGLGTEQRNEIFNNAVHTKDGIEPATLFAQEKVDAAVAWDPDMSDAVAKRPGSKKIYDTRIANRLIADILVVSDSFSTKHPQTLLKFAQGWIEGVEFIKTQPERAYNLIGTVKDFNIPSDLAKTMLVHGRRRVQRRLRQHPRHGAGYVPGTAGH